MPRLLTINAKMKRTTTQDVVVYNFGIPAKNTCPSADGCKEYCYATKGLYAMPSAKRAYEFRFKQTKSPYFYVMMQYEIESLPVRPTHIRIHDSGDFYNKQYALKWYDIAHNNQDIVFYGYTKRIDIFKDIGMHPLPKNLKLIFSYGGKLDHLINPNEDRHSYIFGDIESLERSGYHNATHNDLEALYEDNHRIGLVIH